MMGSNTYLHKIKELPVPV